MNRTQKFLPSRRGFLAGAMTAAVAAGLPRSLSAGEAGSLEQKLAADPLRPRFHLLPAKNWINDPCGPVYWRGKYHMFNQYNPHASVWGDMHWTHAVSTDMVHWTNLGVALAPTPGGPDAAGCFTGSAITHGDDVYIFYTGVQKASGDDVTIKDGSNSLRETQCMAIAAQPDLSAWKKQTEPVIERPPAGMKPTGFRDPSAWKQGDGWYMTVGSGIEGEGGVILLYSSRDLKQWKYEHVLVSGRKNDTRAANPVDTGEMWECPEFFPLPGGKHVLIYSAQGKTLWQVGTLDTAAMLFHGEQTGVLDHGAYYAPKTQLDAHGNRILWGWIQETRREAEYRAAGWAGMVSLPRVLAVDAQARLKMTISPATLALRGARSMVSPGATGDALDKQLQGLTLRGATGELSLKVADLKAPLTLELVKVGAEQAPVLSVRYDPGTGELMFGEKKVALHLADTRALALRIFVDGSVAEVLVNDAEAYTHRFYYAGSEAPDIAVRLPRFAGELQELVAWQIKPISPNRLTTPPAPEGTAASA